MERGDAVAVGAERPIGHAPLDQLEIPRPQTPDAFRHLGHEISCHVGPVDPSTAVSYPAPTRTKTKMVKGYQIGGVIGQGMYGEVRYAVNTDDGSEVAIKILQKKRLKRIRRATEKLHHEMSILSELDSPHVVKFVDAFEIEEKGKLYIVTELVDGGSLDTLLDSSPTGRLSEAEARFYFRQLVAGLQYIHSQGVVHRDIKPSNLVITAKRQLKLTDFGVAELVNKQPHMEDGHTKESSIAGSGGWNGSPAFFAPEVVDGGRTVAKFHADVWAAGVTLYMLVTGQPPFSGTTIYNLFQNICEAKYSIPEYVSDDLRTLLHGMLEPDEARRLTLSQLQESPWFLKDEEIVFTPLPDLTLSADDTSESSRDSDSELSADGDEPSSARVGEGRFAGAVGRGSRSNSHSGSLGPMIPSHAEVMEQVESLPDSDPVKDKIKKSCVVL